MKAQGCPWPWYVTILPVLVLSLYGCTDEKTVFRDRPLFDDPPQAAAGFLGYDEEAENLTVCGNCHVGQQARWENTAHAGAWQTLQESGHAQGLCENCHTVGPNGNPTSGDVGWAGVEDSRYHDVQCESCHGPGLEHVTNPDAVQPQASIAVLDQGAPTKTCGECHTGAHHPFADEWAQSKHAVVEPHVLEGANDPARAACLACHTAQGALRAWGVTDNYIEKNDQPADHQGITCIVCHDPHARDNPKQLRFPIDVPDENVNLCMKCHQRRATPEVQGQTVRGPHSPEGPLLLGEAGWWPPGFEPELDQIVGTHGTGRNPKLCASCHVNAYDVTDPETGDFVFHATGHLFEAIPCTDETGAPIPGADCDLEDRAFGACAVSGCHGSPEAARTVFVTARNRIAALVEEVDHLLTLIPAGEQDPSDGRFTVADGAWFNAELCRLPGSSTHNPYLCEQILVASIQAIHDEYGVLRSSEVSTELIFD